MSRLELRSPIPQLRIKAKAFKQAFFEGNEEVIYGSARFDQMDYDDWLTYIQKNSQPETVDPNWVVSSTFFALSKTQQQIIGIIDIRHNLDNEWLSKYGGHIGYSVIPSERGKGYASEMLQLALEYAKTLSIDRVMITCMSDNIGSQKTIEKCGGELSEVRPYLDGERMNINWIKLR